MLFFRLTSVELGLLFVGVLLAATACGVFAGRRLRHRSSTLKEPLGTLQAALLGIVGLLLAFGLSLAVTRYEDRRADSVMEANAIGTTYLRAQTLPEPMRSRSLALLRGYAETAVAIADEIPGSARAVAVGARQDRIERRLWAAAGDALERAPTASAPRLYVEALNETFDAGTERAAALGNRVPTAVLVLEVVGAAVALGLLAAHLALSGRGIGGVALAAGLVGFLLLVTADLDRPTRGMIRVPDTVLVDQLESMQQPPAAGAPAPAGR